MAVDAKSKSIAPAAPAAGRRSPPCPKMNQPGASHPERVSALILVNGFARGLVDGDYPAGAPHELLDELLAQTDPTGGEATYESVAQFAPSVAQDPEFRRWWQDTGRRGASP